MKITIIIPIHASERYPGKNEALAPYTRRWCECMLGLYPDSVRVVTAGPLPLEPLRQFRHITAEGSQRLVLAEAMKAAPADYYVGAQLTQPVREKWLLPACIGEAAATGKAVVTAYRAPVEHWRIVGELGRWSPKGERSDKLHHDGALYVWRDGQLGDIFDCAAPHGVVCHGREFGRIDVDDPADMPPAAVLAALEHVALKGGAA